MATTNSKVIARLQLLHRAWRYRLQVERSEIAFVLRYLAPGKTAIDIGAHKGAFTYWMAKKLGRSAPLVAFEPLPQLASYLRQIVADYPLPQVVVEETALTAEPGERTLFVPRAGYLGLTSLNEYDHPNGYERVTVATETLDGYVQRKGLPPVGFIKCDVEGHELEVFRGAGRILAEDQPTLLMECEDHRNGGGQLERVTNYLRSFGYECFAIENRTVTPLAECREAMSRVRVGVDAYRNFAFMPPQQAARLLRAA